MKKIFVLIMLCLCLWCFREYTVYASAPSDFEYQSDAGVSFRKIYQAILSGDFGEIKSVLFTCVRQSVFGEIDTYRTTMRQILIFVVFLAVLTNIGQAFRGSDVSKTGFLIGYITVISYILFSFYKISDMGRQILQSSNDFLSAVIPVYAVSIGIVSKSEALVFYEIALIIVKFSELLFLKLAFPMICFYVCVGLINQLGEEDYFSKTCGFIKKTLEFSVKFFIGGIVSLNVIQKMIAGSQGGRIETIIQNISKDSSLPITGLIMGAGKAIRDSLGLAAVIFLLVLILAPVCKALVFVFSYKLLEAVIQPISDSRIVSCLEIVAEGGEMILKILIYNFLMLELTIGIICL